VTKRPLAVFGGPPAFSEILHVGRPSIPDPERVLQSISDTLKGRWLTNRGPLVREFEDRLAVFLGVEHVIATCNGTIALELAERALNLSGEVIVPSFTFVATPHSLQWQGITPVFCDIDPKTHNIDPRKIEKLITPRTTGILGVHLWGRPCQITELEEVAAKHGLRLLFDAAHAFGCSNGGRMIGGFGDAEVFSFHATKFFNTFEGGAIATNDEELAGKLRLMKNFGFAGMDNVVYIGTNGKMSEVSAAMGLVGLESLDDFIEVNRVNHRLYREGLAEIPGISLLNSDESEKHNWQYVVMELEAGIAGLTRDQVIAVLHAENIRARRYFWPGCHRMEPYRSFFPNAGLMLPETERVSERVVVLPSGPAVGPDEVSVICRIITAAVAESEGVAKVLGPNPIPSPEPVEADRRMQVPGHPVAESDPDSPGA